LREGSVAAVNDPDTPPTARIEFLPHFGVRDLIVVYHEDINVFSAISDRLEHPDCSSHFGPSAIEAIPCHARVDETGSSQHLRALETEQRQVESTLAFASQSVAFARAVCGYFTQNVVNVWIRQQIIVVEY
jgi:hypothetical protein